MNRPETWRGVPFQSSCFSSLSQTLCSSFFFDLAFGRRFLPCRFLSRCRGFLLDGLFFRWRFWLLWRLLFLWRLSLLCLSPPRRLSLQRAALQSRLVWFQLLQV